MNEENRISRQEQADEREVAEFVKERQAVLRSLDVERVIKFYAKHTPGGARMSPALAEIAMHKARMHDDGMTDAERDVSSRWLTSRGYSTDIFDGRPQEGTTGISRSQTQPDKREAVEERVVKRLREYTILKLPNGPSERQLDVAYLLASLKAKDEELAERPPKDYYSATLKTADDLAASLNMKLQAAQTRIGELERRMQNIRVVAATKPDRTFDQATRDLDWIADESALALSTPTNEG